MKKLIILLIAALPLAAIAGNGDKDNKKAKGNTVTIHTNKNGGIEITGLSDRELRKLQAELNKALKNVNITIANGKETYQVHLQAEVKID